jgi:hypothetical protein
VPSSDGEDLATERCRHRLSTLRPGTGILRCVRWSRRAVVAAGVAAIVTGALLWPTSRCVRTLIAFSEGQPDPNRGGCVSVVGIPTNTMIAVIVALVAAALVSVVIRSRDA